MSPGYHGYRHIFGHFETGIYQHVATAYRISVFFPYENKIFSTILSKLGTFMVQN